MSSLDQVLKLCPSNIASKLGGRRVCLLNARDIQRSLAQSGASVVACEIPGAPIAAGIVRAARQVGAVLGLSVSLLPPEENPRLHAIFQSLIETVHEAAFEQPLFLRAAPVRVPEASEAAVARAREVIFKLVDAGFTEVGLDVAGLEPIHAAAAIVEATADLRERELSLEVTMSSADPKELASLVASLGDWGAHPDVILVPNAPLTDGAELQQLAAAVGPAALAVIDPPSGLAGQGPERIVLSAPFRALAEQMLGPDASRLCASESFKRLAALDPATRLKLEAFAYHEAVDLFSSQSFQGTGPASLAFLSKRSGY